MNGYGEFPAGAALGRFVECFWTCGELQTPTPVLPDACIDLIYSRSMGLNVAGTMTRPLIAPASPSVCVGVRFRPGMARGFVGLAPAEVAGQVVPLRDIWGGEARKLEERLWNAHGGAEMVCLLRTALQPPSDISSVQSAIEFLARNAGAVSLAQICRVAGLSERQLRRRCLEETGVTPKQLARIARFRQVCCAIHSHPRPNWAKLAIDCGYYDQAHLIHDFQEFSAATPGSYLRQLAG